MFGWGLPRAKATAYFGIDSDGQFESNHVIPVKNQFKHPNYYADDVAFDVGTLKQALMNLKHAFY